MRKLLTGVLLSLTLTAGAPTAKAGVGWCERMDCVNGRNQYVNGIPYCFPTTWADTNCQYCEVICHQA
jgi:hypothetical protein